MSPQQPSLSGAILSSPTDALVLLEAVRLGSLPRIVHRLTKVEREHLIKDGHIFVWEEEEAQMQRWTDGRRWSCSRVCNEFLAYDELEAGTNPTSSLDNKRLKNGLIKTSFASHLDLDGRLPRRFHVVAYHHPSSALSLARPSHDRQLMGVDTSHWRGPVHGRKVASSISSGSSRRQSPTQACSKPYSHPSSRDRSTSFPSPALSNASSTQSHSRTRSVSSSLFTSSALGSHLRPEGGDPALPSPLTTPPLYRPRNLQPVDPSNHFQPSLRPSSLLVLPPLAYTGLPSHPFSPKSHEDFRMLDSIPVRV